MKQSTFYSNASRKPGCCRDLFAHIRIFLGKYLKWNVVIPLLENTTGLDFCKVFVDVQRPNIWPRSEKQFNYVSSDPDNESLRKDRQ